MTVVAGSLNVVRTSAPPAHRKRPICTKCWCMCLCARYAACEVSAASQLGFVEQAPCCAQPAAYTCNQLRMAAMLDKSLDDLIASQSKPKRAGGSSRSSRPDREERDSGHRQQRGRTERQAERAPPRDGGSYWQVRCREATLGCVTCSVHSSSAHVQVARMPPSCVWYTS
jgi:hypothetical protein